MDHTSNCHQLLAESTRFHVSMHQILAFLHVTMAFMDRYRIKHSNVNLVLPQGRGKRPLVPPCLIT